MMAEISICFHCQRCGARASIDTALGEAQSIENLSDEFAVRLYALTESHGTRCTFDPKVRIDYRDTPVERK